MIRNFIEYNAPMLPVKPPWYVTAFAADYLARYQHRSDESALAEIALIRDELQLPASATILDLCCGAGRHSRALLKSTPPAVKVVALDLSADLLHRGQLDSPSEQRLCYVRGDMRALPLQRDCLDGAMNIFTSFGYFESDDEHQRVLDGVARALKPGARFFMDFFNPAPVIAKLPVRSEKMVDDLTIIEDRYLDAQSHRVCKRIEESGPGVQRVIVESVRAYTSQELEALLNTAGLTVQKRYGDFCRAAFDSDVSPRCILVAQKS